MKRSNAIQKTVRTGSGFKERMHIKRFKCANDMHKFLNKQTDNRWQESRHDFKSGVYAFAGGEWHNVKSLDPSILNHI